MATRGEYGLTLVEVMVASVILGLVVTAVTVMIGNSDFLRFNNDHFRQARIIAQEELEDTDRHFLNYGTQSGGMVDLINALIFLDYSEPGLRPMRAYRNVTTTSVPVPPNEADKVFPGDDIRVPYKVVQSTVTWEEAGKTFSVTLSKRIVAVK